MSDCKESENSEIEEERQSCLEETVQGDVYREEDSGRNKTDFEDLVTQAQLSILSGLRTDLSTVCGDGALSGGEEAG